MKPLPAFEVDKKGLEKILERRGKSFAVLELVQNAFDENVTSVEVTIRPTEGSRGYHDIVVEDDSPEGFADLSHAYTLFAESKKKSDPTQRGRFNLGEKLVLACCRRAQIATTTGTITWEGDTRKHSGARTTSGSMFIGELRMNKDEAKEAIKAVKSVIVPDHVEFIVNGEVQPSKHFTRRIVAQLSTEISDEEGFLRPTKRHTSVEVFHVLDGEEPTLYEMGIPVVEMSVPCHLNVQQKIPLNSDRDNVTPRYLRKLHVLLLNNYYDELEAEDVRGDWVDNALDTGDVEPDAVNAVLTARFGKKRVIRDPTDPEANKLAVSQGYTIIEPRTFSKQQWRNIKSSGKVLPAGKVTPSPKPYSEGGEPVNVIPREDWTPGMERFKAWGVGIAQSVLGVRLQLTVVQEPKWRISATWKNPSDLTINLNMVGHKFFNETPGEDQLKLLIHEMGHAYSGDHLSSEYHDALCFIGAKLAHIGALAPEIIHYNKEEKCQS